MEPLSNCNLEIAKMANKHFPKKRSKKIHNNNNNKHEHKKRREEEDEAIWYPKQSKQHENHIKMPRTFYGQVLWTFVCFFFGSWCHTMGEMCT